MYANILVLLAIQFNLKHDSGDLRRHSRPQGVRLRANETVIREQRLMSFGAKARVTQLSV
jgi:hypothetical protein